MASNILLVEDDATIASGLVYALEKEGYFPFPCKNVKAAYDAMDAKRFDFAILDMQLPDGCETAVSEKLKHYGTPVIFLTVVDDENEIVRSFEDGVADYITKPFRLRELLARIKRVLNMKEGRDTSQTVSLLLIFASNKGILLTREQILEKIWDSSGNFVEDNTLTVYIKRLREKLGDAVNIQTVRGIGYRAD